MMPTPAEVPARALRGQGFDDPEVPNRAVPERGQGLLVARALVGRDGGLDASLERCRALGLLTAWLPNVDAGPTRARPAEAADVGADAVPSS